MLCLSMISFGKPVPTFPDQALVRLCRASLDGVAVYWLCSVQASLACRFAIPVERLVVRCDHHALGVEMIVKAFGAAFAADAGIIDAPPRPCRFEAIVVVDPDDAGLDRSGEPMRAADVAGADRGGEPKR